MTAAKVHFIGGAVGAGKTTYARALAAELSAVRFSIDDWMMALFGPDVPSPLDPAWIWARVERCESMIGAVALQVVGLGNPVILDLGFTRKAQRQIWQDRVRAAGYGVQMHWLDVDAPERWRRVQARNQAKGETYALTVTRQMFDFLEARFEPPTVDELRALNGISDHP